MAARPGSSDHLQCPIGLVPFEAEGPNRPILLACSHNVSEEQLKLVRSALSDTHFLANLAYKLPEYFTCTESWASADSSCLQFLNQRASRLNCPLCNHPLPSRSFSEYKPNYGMIHVLQQLQAVPADVAAPATPRQQPVAAPDPQHVYMPGNLPDSLPVVGVGISAETPAAATSELEVLPSAGSEELAYLWPRVVARYWIAAPEVLGNRESWEPWGLNADGDLVYSGAFLLTACVSITSENEASKVLSSTPVYVIAHRRTSKLGSSWTCLSGLRGMRLVGASGL